MKFGQLLVQLPWIVAIQNNSTAAVNNLRRVGARRSEAMAETQRVESRLGTLFQDKGFRVALNWQPPINDKNNPGEVDLICARDDLVLVIEVKSTYLRHSQHDAWQHRTTTLRRAGLQLKRKMEAVRTALITDTQLIASLGRSDKPMTPLICGWIVDTSIECDHERFSGFLKVSFEEVLIALRDEAYLLGDPSQIVDENSAHAEMDSAFDVGSVRTLYPDGITASRFVEVVETEAVWQINVS